MADEFQSGICGGGNWWNTTRNGYNEGSSPCSTGLSDMGSYGWSNEMDAKARSCEESAASASGSSSIVFQDAQKPQGPDSVGGGGSGDGGVLMDSTLQMMGFGLSSPTIDWNQALLRGSGRAESNFHSMLQEDLSSRQNFRHETSMDSTQVQKDWSPTNFTGACEDTSLNAFKPITQVFALDQQRLNSGRDSSGDCTVTCQGLSTSFPMGSASYGCSSSLLHGIFEPDLQPQQSPYENRSVNYASPPNYRMNSNEFSSPWNRTPQFLKASPPKQQPTSNQLHFSNNARFWNASAGTMSDTRSSFLPSPQTQFLTPTFEEKPNCGNLTIKSNIEEGRDSSSVVKKSNSEPPLKRPKIETPSPLPTFKVRKEKLGDRITALQQLVSPFGKTDTASVLLEAIGYIKFLHEQVKVLSIPYMTNGAPIQHHQQNSDKSKDSEGTKQDLRSRGLCLMPISSTFPVTNETTADFWTPTFGGSYR